MNTNEKLIEMSELCQLLKTKDIRTSIKWCDDHKIPTFFIAQKRVAYRFLIDAEIDKTVIQMLKKKYPLKWEKLYEYYQKNDKLGYIATIDMDIKNINEEKIFVKPKSKLSREFLNDL